MAANNRSSLKTAILAKNTENIREVLENQPEADRFASITVSLQNPEEELTDALEDETILSTILEYINTNENRLELIKMFCEQKIGVGFVKLFFKSVQNFKENISDIEWDDLFRTIDVGGKTVLHHLFYMRIPPTVRDIHIHCIEFITSSFSESVILELLLRQDNSGSAPLHCLWLQNPIWQFDDFDPAKLNSLKTSIERFSSVADKLQLFKSPCRRDCGTLAHVLVEEAASSYVYVPDEGRVCFRHQEPGKASYQFLDWEDNRVLANYMLRFLNDTSAVVEVLSTTDWDGKTPMHCVREDRLAALLLQNLTESDQKKLQALRNERFKPLSTEDVMRMSLSSDKYVIPNRTNSVQRCGVILYNPLNRPGDAKEKVPDAHDEAQLMNDSLTKAGFKSKAIQWNCAHKLEGILQRELGDIASKGLSILVVSIMSHGRLGMLFGKNSEGEDTSIAISDLIDQMGRVIPKSIPLVVIIQACQGVTVASPSAPAVTQADASRGNPPLKEHSIVLTRPHTLLLLSTVARGLAKRGAFTGALAKQIAKADGSTPIYHMIAEAKVDMDRTITDNQTSEVRDTLKRKLVLPAPTAETTNPPRNLNIFNQWTGFRMF